MESNFLLAVESRDEDAFRSLVERGSTIFSDVTPHGNTILHFALMYGRYDLAGEICTYNDGYLLLWKANSRGETPLHYAAASSYHGVLSWAEDVLGCLKPSNPQQREVVLELLRARDVEGNTALSTAAASGHRALVSLMLEMDGDLSVDVNNAGESPLYRAAVGGRREVVSILLDRPSPTDRRGPCGRTVLHAAVRNSDFETKRMIVAAMPQQKDEADDFGCTPMHYAVYSGDSEMVLHLISNGSDAAYYLNNNGRSPLHEAVAMGLMDAVQVMVSHCPDSTEARDSGGKSALHIAVECGRHEIIRFLLSANKQLVKHKDADGNTPLHIASLKSDPDALYALVKDSEVNLFAENHSGQTFTDMVATQPTAGNLWKMTSFHAILTMALSSQPTLARTTLSKYNETMKTGAGLLYDRRMKKISIMAALIATVTFAAGLTVPGGSVNSGPDEGAPTLVRTSAFRAFMVFDTLALWCSLALVALGSIKTEMAEIHIIALLLQLADGLVLFSLTSVSMAFATGVYAILAPNSVPLATTMCILCVVLTYVVWAPLHAVEWLPYDRFYQHAFDLPANSIHLLAGASRLRMGG